MSAAHVSENDLYPVHLCCHNLQLHVLALDGTASLIIQKERIFGNFDHFTCLLILLLTDSSLLFYILESYKKKATPRAQQPDDFGASGCGQCERTKATLVNLSFFHSCWSIVFKVLLINIACYCWFCLVLTGLCGMC